MDTIFVHVEMSGETTLDTPAAGGSAAYYTQIIIEIHILLHSYNLSVLHILSPIHNSAVLKSEEKIASVFFCFLPRWGFFFTFEDSNIKYFEKNIYGYI